jgi:hypothetical protein
MHLCNASIAKSFKNMAYLEGGPFTYQIGKNKPKNILSKQHQVVMTRSQLLEGFKCESKLKTTEE